MYDHGDVPHSSITILEALGHVIKLSATPLSMFRVLTQHCPFPYVLVSCHSNQNDYLNPYIHINFPTV